MSAIGHPKHVVRFCWFRRAFALLVWLPILLGTQSATAATPTITSFTPTSGAVGTSVTINGTNFSGTPASNTVKFNGIAATTPSSATTTKLVVLVPTGATTGTISVTVGTTTGTSSGTFTVAPTITSFTPTIGPVGTSVTINGTNFSTAAAGNIVMFNGIAATTPSSATAIKLVVTVPSGATTGPITVTVGTLTGTSGSNFTVSPPTITSFTPASGPVGTSVTINGTNFSTTAANNIVKFNGITAATPTSATAIKLVVTVPSGATTGTISVTVGALTGTSGSTFTVSPPTITGFTPTSGPVGTSVTITGTNFSTTAANNTVKFNGVAAAAPTSATATQLVVAVPIGATTGTISVTVGALTGTSSGTFTVSPPTITSFTPASGAVGTTVTITGTNFSATKSNNTVKFNGTSAATPTTATTTQLVVTVPSGATTGTITVTVGALTGTSSSTFTVAAPPTITGFTPTSGPIGTSVTITGTNFSATPSGNTVKFNGTAAATPTSASVTQLVVAVPSGATTGTIAVTVGTLTGTSGTSFTVTTPPIITSFTPTSGAVGATVTINGSNFSPTKSANTVKFNGTPTAVPTTATATQLVVAVPSGATTGTITVTVGTLTGTSATNFTVTTPAPTITGFAPTSGPVGTVVTITGTNFSTVLTGNAVTFNGTAAAVTSASTTQIVASVPSGASTGKISVTVGTQTATSGGTFTITVANPTITGFTPGSGPVGATVTITGTNFDPNPANDAVAFHGIAAVVSSATSTQLVATVPAGATTGTIKVTVSARSVTSTASFTVTPSITDLDPASTAVGNTINIDGYNFSTTRSANAVAFNGTPASVSVATATQLQVVVPNGATSGPVTVTVGGNVATSPSPFIVVPPPTIADFSPKSGPAGTTVVITGTNFDPNPANDVVLMGLYSTQATIVSATSTTLTVTVPPGVTTGRITVGVKGSYVASSAIFTTPPGITGFTPLVGSIASILTISGQSFDQVANNNIVFFNNPLLNGFVRAQVVSATQTSLSVIVPAGAGGTISVLANGVLTTSSASFQLIDQPLSLKIYGTALINLDFTPGSGAAGDLATIAGTGFSSVPSNNSVTFNGAPANVVTASSDLLVVTVPNGASTGPIAVTVGGQTVTSTTNFTVIGNAHLLVPMPAPQLSKPNGQLGYSVAADGDTVAVSALNAGVGSATGTGVVYVFARTNGTNWSLQGTLAPDVSTPGQNFGASVAVQGDTLVVGAPDTSAGGGAYVFTRNAGVWSQQAKLTAASTVAGDRFGATVGLDQGTVAIGAPHAGTTINGVVHVFVASGSNWTEQASLQASDAAPGAAFGAAVSISADSLLVGASGANAQAGTAYVFVRSGVAWSQQAELSASDAATGAAFGNAVALSGDKALIGAPANVQIPGAAYFFNRTGTTWNQIKEVSGNDRGESTSGDAFGGSVALQGNAAVIGGSGINYGMAYSYIYTQFSPGVWNWAGGVLNNGDGEESDKYGFSVALSGTTIVIGSPLVTNSWGFSGGAGEGLVQIWKNGALQAVMPTPGVSPGSYGSAIAISGDTAIVGNASDDTNFDWLTGSVYVFVRSGSVWVQQAKFNAPDDAPKNLFGASVAIDGDTALVGAPATSTTASAAYVFVRQGSTWTYQAKLDPAVNPGPLYNLNYVNVGSAVAINGNTAIVTSPSTNIPVGKTTSSMATVYVRSGNAWNYQATIFPDDANPNNQYNTTVALDADTAVFGAQGSAPNKKAYVFTRSAGSWTQQGKLSPSSPNFSDFFGQQVAISGDRILIASPDTQVTSASTPVGYVYAFNRAAGAWSQASVLSAWPAVSGFGDSLALDATKAVVGARYAFSDAHFNDFGVGYFMIPEGNAWAQSCSSFVERDESYAASSDFGGTLATSGNTVVGSGSGKAFAFLYTVPTTTTQIMSVDPNPVSLNTKYTITATVAAVAGCARPAGQILVSDGIGNTCSINPALGSTCKLNATQIGTRNLTASFVPTDANWYQPSSATASVTVAQYVPSVNVQVGQVSPGTSTVGQPFTVHASVTPVAPASTQPGGTVTVSNLESSCSFALPADNCSLTGSSVASYLITARYGGDSTYGSSVSDPVAHTVTLGIARVTIMSVSPEPSDIYQPYSVTVSVAADAGFTGTPTGTVIVADGVNGCSITLPNTSCNLASSVAEHALLVATYSGDLAFAPSTSAAVAHVVGSRASVFVTSVGTEPSMVGHGYLVQAAAAPVAPATRTPSGSITISDGTNSCTFTLPSSGCTLNSTITGIVQVTASYSGDQYFAPSVSPPANHAVSSAGGATALPPGTEICGFDPKATYPAASGFVPIAQLPALVPSAGLITAITGTGTLSVDISTPQANATIAGNTVDVVGTFVGPTNTGITVNGVVAYTQGGKFLAQAVPLKAGANVLNVVATTLTGVTATNSLHVNQGGTASPVSIDIAGPSSTGFAPAAILFHYSIGSLSGVRSVSLDYDGNGLIDWTGTSLANAPNQLTYSRPGLFKVVLTVVDLGGSVYTAQRQILIEDLVMTRSTLCDVYGYLKDRLNAQDATGAASAYQPLVRSQYQAQFAAIGTGMPAMVPMLGAIGYGYVAPGYAELTLVRDNADQTRSGFPLRMTLGSDGVWRISEM
jgi:FG-GAP repeat/IPT/TIG domain/Bacterial Ig-like domain (group 3)